MFFNNILNSLKLTLFLTFAAFSVLFNSAIAQDDDCEVEVTFTWTLDSDWCESWCKVRNANNQVVGVISQRARIKAARFAT